MKKLVKWQFRHYRDTATQVMLGLLIVTAVLAWLSYTLFNLSAQLVVAVFRMVQGGALGGALVLHYLPYISMHQAKQDAHTLPLHVPLPQRSALFAKIIAVVPLLLSYVTTNSVLFHSMGTDLPQLQELAPERSLVRAALFILIAALLMNGLVLRTLQRQLVRLPIRWPIINLFFDLALLLGYASIAGLVIGVLEASGVSAQVEALVFVVAGLALTYANGYLLERYTPQLEY